MGKLPTLEDLVIVGGHIVVDTVLKPLTARLEDPTARDTYLPQLRTFEFCPGGSFAWGRFSSPEGKAILQDARKAVMDLVIALWTRAKAREAERKGGEGQGMNAGVSGLGCLRLDRRFVDWDRMIRYEEMVDVLELDPVREWELDP